jgi:hypothetical protein
MRAFNYEMACAILIEKFNCRIDDVRVEYRTMPGAEQPALWVATGERVLGAVTRDATSAYGGWIVVETDGANVSAIRSLHHAPTLAHAADIIAVREGLRGLAARRAG